MKDKHVKVHACILPECAAPVSRLFSNMADIPTEVMYLYKTGRFKLIRTI